MHINSLQLIKALYNLYNLSKNMKTRLAVFLFATILMSAISSGCGKQSEVDTKNNLSEATETEETTDPISATKDLIIGTVFSSAANQPLLAAKISVDGEYLATTDIEGKFSLDKTEANSIIRIKKEGYVGLSLLANGTNEELTIRLAPIWELESANQIYADVPLDTWFEPAIKMLYERQVLSAKERSAGNLQFRPSDNLTRGELAILLTRTAGFLPEKITETSFCDTKPDDWFAEYAEFTHAQNWLPGFDSKECGKRKAFLPKLEVSRGEAIISVINLIDKLKVEFATDLDCPSALSPVSSFAPFIDRATCLGIIEQEEDFRPNDPISRAEIAVMLANVLKKLD